jgi:hypothetical protein
VESVERGAFVCLENQEKFLVKKNAAGAAFSHCIEKLLAK